MDDYKKLGSNLSPAPEWTKRYAERRSWEPVLTVRCAYSDDVLSVRSHACDTFAERGLRFSILREVSGKAVDLDVVLVRDGMIELLKVIHRYLEETR